MLYYRAASTEDGHEHAGHGHIRKMLKRARMSDYMAPNDFRSSQKEKSLDPAFFALGVTASNECFSFAAEARG